MAFISTSPREFQRGLFFRRVVQAFGLPFARRKRPLQELPRDQPNIMPKFADGAPSRPQ